MKILEKVNEIMLLIAKVSLIIFFAIILMVFGHILIKKLIKIIKNRSKK